mgnify:CR=1 FL=1
MALTVGEILNMEEFREYRLICGKKGLGREVSTVTVLDTPDAQDWLRGGEIVLSSGYLLQQMSPADCQNLIHQLAECDASALFVKLGPYLRTVDEAIVKAANEEGLPIVSAPAGCIFSDIISPIVKKLIDMQSSALRLSENISTSFINTVINDGGITDVINTIATLLNQNIAFYDLAFNKIYPSKNASLRDGFKESFLSYPHMRVSLDDKDYGFIVIDDSRQDLSDYETMILTHASTALKLIAQKYISNMEIETRYRDGFVQDIVLNNIKSLQEVVKRGKIYGWDLSEKFYTVIIVDIDDFKQQYLNIRSKEDNENIEKHNDEIFDYSLKFFRRFFKSVLYTKFTDSTAFIIKHDKPDEATAQKILSCCDTLKGELHSSYNFTVTIGISDPKGSIMDCHLAYQEAQKAVKISRLVYKRDNTATYSTLGIYKFLDGIKDNQSVQDFYKGYIEKICRHDELHNTDFMETLINIVQNGWNLKLASDTMFLHYNTIKYRYKKIEEISGLNLDRTEEKLSMELAVKIYLMTHI